MIGARPLDFDILHLLMHIPPVYADTSLKFLRLHATDALKEFYLHHRDRDTRKIAQLVVYASWMVLSRSLNLLERSVAILGVFDYLSSDDISEFDLVDLDHAQEICRYICRKRKRE